MRSPIVLLSISLAVASCSTIELAGEADRTLIYRCDDTVVVGRLNNGASYRRIEIEGDLLGHGWMQAELRVMRVIQGSAIPDQLDVRYFGHTYFREDRDFMFVLTKSVVDGFTVDAAQMMQMKPIAIRQCD